MMKVYIQVWEEKKETYPTYMMQGAREKEARRVQFDQKNERGDFTK